MKPTICVRRDSRFQERGFDDAFLELLFGEADAGMQAAAFERIGNVAARRWRSGSTVCLTRATTLPSPGC